MITSHKICLSRRQCDQIGQFVKDLGDNSFWSAAQIFVDFSGYF